MRLVLLVVVGLTCVPTAAFANVGRERFPGARATEPVGIHDVAIRGEQLAFDLRPLVERAPVQVSATYQLVVRGPTFEARLVFVAGASSILDEQVALDGAPLRGTIRALSEQDVAAFPASWKPPATTPALDHAGALAYEVDDASSGGFGFSLVLAPGEHTLEVRYRVRAQEDRSREGGTLVWQLGYVLAPARDWGGFGGLDVRVEVPTGWRAATSPELVRSGDVLTARFAALPGDSIGITVQAPTGWVHDLAELLAWPIVAAIAVAGLGFLYRVGCAERRSRWWPAALVGWVIALGATGSIAAVVPDLWLSDGQSAYYGYGHAIFTFLVVVATVLAIPLGLAAVKLGARRGRQRRGNGSA